MDTATKQQLLDALYAPYTKCRQCPLGSLGRTTVVFGEGNLNASIMIIGEGPGQQEDEQGRPFIGRSGKLLTRALAQAGIERHQVFITNSVKCRPPSNRTPTKNESSTCTNLLLLQQIKIIKPRVLCTLGSSALASFIPGPIKMSLMHGKPIDWQDLIILPTYHPAYILRSPKQLIPFVSDLIQAQQLSFSLSGG